jgi:aspartokinase
MLLVVSAMGKTTNALEVVKDYFDKSAALQSSVQEIKKYHNQILMDLFETKIMLFFCCDKITVFRPRIFSIT